LFQVNIAKTPKSRLIYASALSQTGAVSQNQGGLLRLSSSLSGVIKEFPIQPWLPGALCRPAKLASGASIDVETL